MNKKLMILAFLLVALVLSAANPFPAILTIRNRSGGTVFMQLTGDDNYFFTVPSGRTMQFEVTRDIYSSTVTACDTTVSGVIDLNTNVRLSFPNCYKQFRLLEQGLTEAFGEPTLEKVNMASSISDLVTVRIYTDPLGNTVVFPHAALTWWYFQY